MWPVPNPLSGIKSRKRPLFQALDCAFAGTDGVTHLSQVTVTLDSRIAAIGLSGSVAADMLLNKQTVAAQARDAANQPKKHDDLVVSYLGPHLAGLEASIDKHSKAIEAALRDRPHIVVIDEALHGGPAWVHTYTSTIQSEALQAFRGALIICTSEDSLSTRKLCSEEWVLRDGVIHQSNLPQISLDIIDGFLKVEAVEASGKKASKRRGGHNNNLMSDILQEELRELSEYCFEEDATIQAATKGWKVTLLTDTDLDGMKHVRGYISYKLYPHPRAEMHIQRLAVPRKHRLHGYAATLVRWALAKAARMPMSECATIRVSALDSVVPFYSKFGFSVDTSDNKDATDDDCTWMVQQNTSLISE